MEDPFTGKALLSNSREHQTVFKQQVFVLQVGLG
jgi:hypothetical protein